MREIEEQFVKDFLLVTENHFEAYTEAREMALGGSVPVVADRLKGEFEFYIHQVADREEQEGRDYGAQLLREMLLNWGSRPWETIARHIISEIEE